MKLFSLIWWSCICIYGACFCWFFGLFVLQDQLNFLYLNLFSTCVYFPVMLMGLGVGSMIGFPYLGFKFFTFSIQHKVYQLKFGWHLVVKFYEIFHAAILNFNGTLELKPYWHQVASHISQKIAFLGLVSCTTIEHIGL